MIIAIEGIDGSGKSLQFNLLDDKLRSLNRTVRHLSFPRYETFIGKEIGSMLSGGTKVRADEVDAKSMALWYAVDRKQCFDKIERGLELSHCEYLLLNRYTLSNAVYQGLRVPKSDRADFARWVFELEHTHFKLPVPDKYIILDVDVTASADNIKKKGYRDYVGNNADVYENQPDFMREVRELYLDFSKQLPNVFVVRCMENDAMLSPELIHSEIFKIISD